MCQKTVDLLILDVFLPFFAPKTHFWTKLGVFSCWSVHFMKNLYSKDISQTFPRKNWHVFAVKTCWFDKTSLSRPKFLYVCVGNLLICQKFLQGCCPKTIYVRKSCCWFDKNIPAKAKFFDMCVSETCWFVKKACKGELQFFARAKFFICVCQKRVDLSKRLARVLS